MPYSCGGAFRHNNDAGGDVALVGGGNIEVEREIVYTYDDVAQFVAAFQYRVLRKLWPEFEVNATFWPNGKLSGDKQVFISRTARHLPAH